MDKAEEGSFLADFHRIQQALKKGIFKKVDHAGSAEELIELGALLQREGSAPHAAICLMAAAQCERALENPTAVASHEARAGQLLWREQMRLSRVDETCFRSLVPEATQCYLGAIRVYLALDHKALAGSLYAEMADLLWALGTHMSVLFCRARMVGCLLERARGLRVLPRVAGVRVVAPAAPSLPEKSCIHGPRSPGRVCDILREGVSLGRGRQCARPGGKPAAESCRLPRRVTVAPCLPHLHTQKKGAGSITLCRRNSHA
jgi:hypothetical protein